VHGRAEQVRVYCINEPGGRNMVSAALFFSWKPRGCEFETHAKWMRGASRMLLGARGYERTIGRWMEALVVGSAPVAANGVIGELSVAMR
jgi:hypothetical protein